MAPNTYIMANCVFYLSQPSATPSSQPIIEPSTQSSALPSSASPSRPSFPPSASSSNYSFVGLGACSDANGYVFDSVKFTCGPLSDVDTCAATCASLNSLEYWNNHNGISFIHQFSIVNCYCYYDSDVSIPQNLPIECWQYSSSPTAPNIGYGEVMTAFTQENPTESCLKRDVSFTSCLLVFLVVFCVFHLQPSLILSCRLCSVTHIVWVFADNIRWSVYQFVVIIKLFLPNLGPTWVPNPFSERKMIAFHRVCQGKT